MVSMAQHRVHHEVYSKAAPLAPLCLVFSLMVFIVTSSLLTDADIKARHLRITDMEYADDVFLSAESPAHLQALTDTMTRHSEDLHMQISVAKTKVSGCDRNHTFT